MALIFGILNSPVNNAPCNVCSHPDFVRKPISISVVPLDSSDSAVKFGWFCASCGAPQTLTKA